MVPLEFLSFVVVDDDVEWFVKTSRKKEPRPETLTHQFVFVAAA